MKKLATVISICALAPFVAFAAAAQTTTPTENATPTVIRDHYVDLFCHEELAS
jgi:hypothetical protein